MSRMIKATSIAMLLCGVLASADALACSFAGPEPFVINETLGADALAVPDAVTFEVVSIERGRAGTLLDDGTVSSDSCDDIGSIGLRVLGAEQEIGYEYKLARGTPPEEGILPKEPIHAGQDGSWWMVWVDGSMQEQEEVDFWVTITPVNRAGVRGPVSEPIHIYDPGRAAEPESEPEVEPDMSEMEPAPEEEDEAGGCQQVGSSEGPASPWLFAVGMMGVWLWRRRELT